MPPPRQRRRQRRAGGASASPAPRPGPPPSLLRRFATRSLSGASMLGGFGLVVAAGHGCCVLLVLLLTAGMFREVVALRLEPRRGGGAPAWPATWSFYGASVAALAAQMGPLAPAAALPPAQGALLAYCLYALAVAGFVLSLRPAHYGYQFALLAWGQATLALVVVPGFAHIRNLEKGLVWFLLPASFVICNDIMAMVCGSFLPGGRTPLISVSPAKTWEGFCGGAVFTLALAVTLSAALAADPALHSWLACPPAGSGWPPFGAAPASCREAVELFAEREFAVAGVVWMARPILVHSLVLALFASTVAPFGGFLASGFKRAVGVEDFAVVIPGHGGITDRMDCMIPMGAFVHFYLESFVATAER